MEIRGAGAGYPYRESTGQKTKTGQTGEFADSMRAARQSAGAADPKTDLPGRRPDTENASADENVQEENPLNTTEELMRFIRERKQEIYDRVRKGETEIKIPIGAQEYSEKEWKKLMDSFDEAQDELRELLREEWERRRKEWIRQKELNEESDEEAAQEKLVDKLLEDRTELKSADI